MAFNKLATKYDSESFVVDSFDDIVENVRIKFPNEVKNLPLPGFNVKGANGEYIKPRFHGLFLVDSDGIPTAEVGDSSVSPKYVPHSRDDIEILLEAARQAFRGNLRVHCSWNDAHILVVKPTQETFLELYSQERISPRLSIFAGFAGRSINASLGLYNTLCDNMALMSTVHAVNASIRHTLSMRDRLAELVRQFETIQGSWADTQVRIKQLNEKTVNTAQILKEIFGDIPEKGKGRTQLENRIEKIVTRLNNESMRVGRDLGSETTGWRLFNALQGAFQHDFTRAQNDPILRALDTWGDSTLEKAERVILAC